MRRGLRARALRGRSEGFTLIEVMIALVILAFGLITMALMQLTAMNGGRAGRHSTQAAVVARDQMELFQHLAWTDAQLNATGWTAPTTVNSTPQGGVGTEQSYAVSWRITNVDPNWIKNVDVRVSWNEPNFTGRTLTISSTRYNDPW
jgi:prepilin-type N-terminal cleavage/methylation domain-containing protein